MDLNALRIFVTAVRLGSLSAAAAALRIPLPTVSRQIRQLETDLRAELVTRTAKGVVPTAMGLRLYEASRDALLALEEGERDMAAHAERPRGKIRVSVPPHLYPWQEMLGAFQSACPDIALSVMVTERKIDLVREGVDVAMRIGPVVDDSLICRQLHAYRHRMVASTTLIERLGPPSGPEDLARYPVAMWRPNDEARPELTLGGRKQEVAPCLSVNDYDMLYRWALRHEVVTELPPFMAEAGIADGRLVAILPNAPLPEIGIHLVYPVSRFRTVAVRTYIAFCQRHLADGFRRWPDTHGRNAGGIESADEWADPEVGYPLSDT